MIFYLDDDIARKKDVNSIIAIQNIAECIQAGRHIFIANRGLLRSLYTLETLSDVTRRVYRMLYQRVTQLFEIKGKVKTYIHISGDITEVKKVEKNNQIIYKMPLALFSDSKNLQETKLVCEDLFDCEFYKALTNYCMNKFSFGGSMSFQNVSGGGVNIGRMYEYTVSTSYTPCLVIADSDKSSSTAKLGRTAQNIVDTYDRCSEQRITYSYILKVREKENLIPPEVYYTFETDENIKKQFELLIRIYNKERFRNTYLWGDIKDGFNKADDGQSIKEFVVSEIKDILNKDCTIDELREISKSLRKYLGDNVLCTVLDELYESERKNQIIQGVKSTFIRFKKDILENGIKKEISRKKQLNEKHSSDCLTEEVIKLENQLDNVNVALQTSLKDEFINYWLEIAGLCYNWGCKIKIHVA